MYTYMYKYVSISIHITHAYIYIYICYLLPVPVASTCCQYHILYHILFVQGTIYYTAVCYNVR